MDRLASLRGQTLFAVSFARNFVEFRFLPPPETSPVVIEISDEPESPSSDFPARDELAYDPSRSRFYEAVLRAFTAPVLSANGRQFAYPAPGARDGLCALIDDSVDDVVHTPGAHIKLAFVAGAELHIPLRKAANPSDAAVHFEHHGVMQLY
jgi:hypothetical protein